MDVRLKNRTTLEPAPGSTKRNPNVRALRWSATLGLTLTIGLAGLLLTGGGALGAPVAIEPCSVLSLEEATTVLKGPAKQEVPSPIRYQGISTGGTCVYRLRKDPMVTITVRVDATPTGAQRQRFAAGLRRGPAAEFSGLGDRAYTEIRTKGPQSVTFLRGETLTTVTVEGLGIDEAKQVAALVAPRLPASTGEPPPSPPKFSRSAASTHGSGHLDPALVGSWFLKQPDGRALANLDVKRDGTFSMMLLAGAKMQSGRIEGENGILRLHPERGGRVQELRYRIVDKNQMEWTDQKGNVTITRRQFR